MTWVGKGTGEARGDYTLTGTHLGPEGTSWAWGNCGQESKPPSAPLLGSSHPHPRGSTSEPRRWAFCSGKGLRVWAIPDKPHCSTRRVLRQLLGSRVGRELQAEDSCAGPRGEKQAQEAAITERHRRNGLVPTGCGSAPTPPSPQALCSPCSRPEGRAEGEALCFPKGPSGQSPSELGLPWPPGVQTTPLRPQIQVTA